jgi:hypothetical protein
LTFFRLSTASWLCVLVAISCSELEECVGDKEGGLKKSKGESRENKEKVKGERKNSNSHLV